MSSTDGFSKFVASLRIFGEELKPTEVSGALGVEPTDCWEKGAPGYKQKPRPAGMWVLESGISGSNNLEAQLRELLSRTSKSADAWLSLLSRFKADIFVGAWMSHDNAVIQIAPEILAEAGRRGLPLVVDLYFVERES